MATCMFRPCCSLQPYSTHWLHAASGFAGAGNGTAVQPFIPADALRALPNSSVGTWGDMPSNSKNNQNQYVGVGVAIGVAIGAGLGVAFGNFALGLGPGIAIGVALGVAMSRRNRTGDCSKQPPDQHDPEL